MWFFSFRLDGVWSLKEFMKKYPRFLLYIHNPLFELEKHKSKLVNKLLDRHYEKKKPKKVL